MKTSWTAWARGHWRALSAAVLLTLSGAAGADAPPSIAAAADLKYALDDILAGYAREHDDAARVTYGSSGQFFTQLQQGAPFDIFLSADESLVNKLATAGLTQGGGDLYGLGRLVLFVPRGVAIALDEDGADVRRALADGRLHKFAIANPDHAPYGRAAHEALRAMGLLNALAPHLVLGENVAQAAQFVVSRAAEAGIFALSLALAPPYKDAGHYLLLAPHLHAPLRQRMVMMRGASPAAAQLYAYLKSPAARAVFERYGFSLPAP